jgi:hypothetical protein
MNLFVCGTIFQLITAINITVSNLKVNTDLILTDSTDFSEIEKKLEELNIFCHIYHMKDDACKKDYWTMNEKQRKQLSKYPSKGIDPIELIKTYEHLYLPSLSAYNKLFYYYLIKGGMKLKVHLYEEGITTYVIDVVENIQKDGMLHRHYGKQALDHNLVEIMLYEPELYSVPRLSEIVTPIPKLSNENVRLVKAFRSVFGECALPKEKYIFLEEAFVKDGILSMDIELVEELASVVGKDNIVVKLHPRNPVDRFSMRGFSLFPNSKIPWEIILLSNDLREKVLVTVSSSSSITAKLILNKPMYAIQLYSMMYIGRAQHIKQKAFQDYYAKLYAVLNREEKCLYTPDTKEELHQIIQYLDR